jgi:hypothetical protein
VFTLQSQFTSVSWEVDGCRLLRSSPGQSRNCSRVRIVAGEKVDSVRGESLVRAGKGSFPDYFRGYQVSQVRKLMSESDPLRSRSIHQK